MARHCDHPLQGWSRLISRSLQLLCSAVSAKKQNLGFATMLGVRDQIGALGGVVGKASSSEFCELDMDNVFWAIPQHEAIQSMTWAFDACRKGKNDLWFSLARGGEKALDRIGKSSGTQFFFVSEAAFRRFVESVMPSHYSDPNTLRGVGLTYSGSE